MLRKLFLLFLLSTLFSCSDTVRLQPLSQDSIILAFGDSLTYGTGTSRDNAYPAVLDINAGVSGETSNRGLLRLENLIDQFQPDLIIICHGANDILRKLDLNRTRDNIQQMIDMARQNNSQVMLIGVPEFNLFLGTSPIYQSLAEQNKIPLEENSLSNIIGNNALKSDHVHPNSDGYRVLAKNITSLLERSGAIQPLE